MQMAIQADGLRKSYHGKEVVHGIDLAVPPGTVLAMLGPNGAGKTTTVRMLATLLRPDGGCATVAGHDVLSSPREVRRRIGLTGQYAAVDARLTGRENLRLCGVLHKMGRRGAAARAEALIDKFDLGDVADAQARTYSGGMRRRLDLAAGLVGNPEVIFLDEPTTGLDPASRQQLWSMVRSQVAEGVTVLLTTQYLEEADQLADSIVVVDDGRIVAAGTADELKSQAGRDQVEISLPAADVDQTIVPLLASAGFPDAVTTADRRTLSVPVTDCSPQTIAAIAGVLDLARIGITGFHLRKPTLDEVFLSLTGRPAGDAAAVAPPTAPAAGDPRELLEVS